MHALKDLFTTDVGLMSIGGLAIMLGLGAGFFVYLVRHVRQDAARAACAALAAKPAP